MGATVALLASCNKDGANEVSGRSREIPDEVITEFVTEESDNGLARWRLSAPRADRYNSRKLFALDKPKIEFFDEYGNLQSTLTSDAGELLEAEQYMLAYGNVVVVTFEGDVLETDTLRYLVEEDKIVNDCFNKLTRPGEKTVVTGYGLECDHNLATVDIKRNVEAIFFDEAGIISDRGLEGDEGNADDGN
jgi:LPS export ABC transporter protein LptC